MNPFQPFYNMKIGIVDLSASSAEVVSLNRDEMIKYPGGAAMNRMIFNRHQGDPIIFGTGPLTGSFAPASSLMIATFRSPRFERLCHIPFMLRTGPDMKFSGIDFLAVKGTAAEPSILSVTNGKIQILPAGNLLERKTSPYFQSLITTGPAADRGIPYAAVSIGSKGSLDKAGLASLMNGKNLKGVVFNGTGGLPFHRDNPAQGKELENKISRDKNFKERGFFSVLKKLEGGKDAGNMLKYIRKKDMACYHCPSPCMTHVTFSLLDAGKKEKILDGLLLLDHLGCAALAKKVGKSILPVLRSCLHYGLNPSGVAGRLSTGGTLAEYLDAVDKLMSDNLSHFTGVTETYDIFGGGVPPILKGDVWEKRAGLAMILGVCPIFLLRFPQITDADLLAFIYTKGGDLKSMQEALSPAIDSLFL